MPELPEVETIRRSLETLILGRYIEELRLYDRRALLPEDKKDILLGSRMKIRALRRKGKYLLIDAADDNFDHSCTFLVHLRMTGRLIVRNLDEFPDYKTGLSILLSTSDTSIPPLPKFSSRFNYIGKYNRDSNKQLSLDTRKLLFMSRDELASPIFSSVDGNIVATLSDSLDQSDIEYFNQIRAEALDNNTKVPLDASSDYLFLDFQDTRRFGSFQILPFQGEEDSKSFKILGVDAVSDEFTPAYFITHARKHPKLNIKAFILNQSVVAGFGNIYADETLFRAAILPTRLLSDLSDSELETIAILGKEILLESIGFRGCSFRDYVDGLGNKGQFQYELKVYQREKQPCVKCSTTIEKTVVAGRGTRFCPNCQK